MLIEDKVDLKDKSGYCRKKEHFFMIKRWFYQEDTEILNF